MSRGISPRRSRPTTPGASPSLSSRDGARAVPFKHLSLTNAPRLLERVVIESVRPDIDGGCFPAKAVAGQTFVVEADVFAEYEPIVCCVLLHRHQAEESWTETQMRPEGDDLERGEDHLRGEFLVDQPGTYYYTLEGWIDAFETWRRLLTRKVDARQDVSAELQIGAGFARGAAARASGVDAKRLLSAASRLASDGRPRERIRIALSDALAALMQRYPDRSRATRYDRELAVTVDPPKAVFSTWYELFPRSWSPEPGHHGTFRDLEGVLPYVAGMGFDVLYLPPIHPIGRAHRKGKNNSLTAKPGEPGSPWAIGSEEGGHKSVHPQLGTLQDFRRLVARAAEHRLDVALDIAFQCSPDHPYVREHPQWFRRRPDGSIQYAENPPKKYEDIYPFDFGTEDWQALWEELKSVFVFWARQGVRIFRVDNPHTKPFRFWEWTIAEVKREFPDVIFLSEAFTRPRLMERLAKCGFTQSYTYFAWKTEKKEIEDYFTQLARPPLSDYFRPNAWPNTPDILTEYLVSGGRPAFIVRYVLAATLSGSCGIYGPAFELQEHIPARPGSEEYLNSEKYELKRWDIERKESLRYVIARVNQVRSDNPALQANERLTFHPIDHPQLICYSKRTADAGNIIVTAVNLDPKRTHSGHVELPLEEWGLEPRRSFAVQELLGDTALLWRGRRQLVRLDPKASPAAIYRLRGNVKGQHRDPP